ncbi:MAG: glycosyltransferase family 2 protein [Armatimonadetes bacterium]|nr:glycosyltransferase family 2 protein [Armatimonadota bacterium]
MELVSAIIPAYNAADTLGRAIDSVLAQTYPHIEIIVVNDGSTDHTERVVTENYPQVRYHYQENRGLAHSRNVAASLATGEVLAMLDADDAWLPTKVERQLQVLRECPDIAAVSCHRVRVKVDAEGRELWRRSSPHADGRLQEIGFLEEIWGNKVCGPAIMVRRSAFERHGGYDPTLLAIEDLDLWLRMIAAGDKVAVLREPLYLFYERPGSLRTQLDKVEPAWAKILEKWDPARDPAAARLLSVEKHREVAKWWWLKLAFHALRLGDRERAGRYAQRASGIPATNGSLWVAAALARNCPWLFYQMGRVKGFPRTTG